jgi:eukaryotic-like serine/threonine-protein kinase
VRVCPRCKATYVAPRATCAVDQERLIETDRDPLIGQTISRYDVLEYLGSGGMGRVYRARHSTIEREYAIKVLYGDLAIDDTFRARFRREASTVSKIRHSNVVSVSDYGVTEEGLSFIVMELIWGRTLLKTIDNDGPLVPTRAGRIARQIAEALSAAHGAGFIHRDIKSTNVMLMGRAPEESVKVLDFGTVALRQQKVDDRLTTVGQLIGTPAYMAPEQFEDPAVGPSADLYSLGVVLYHMLAGRLPFAGVKPTELMVQHMTMQPPPLPACGGLERLALKLLQKEPQDRLRSADEVIRAIDRLVLDGSTDGFATETEPVPVVRIPSAPQISVQVLDRPPIAESPTPREEDVPTVRPEEGSGDLEAPSAPIVYHDHTETSTMRDTEPELVAPGVPVGTPHPKLESAPTRLLSQSSPPPPSRRPSSQLMWPLAVFIAGLVALALVMIWSLLK